MTTWAAIMGKDLPSLMKVASLLMETLVNIRGEETPSRKKGCSFKEFDEHPFPVFRRNMNSQGSKKWFMDMVELL
jgi:hypothetical protein